MSDNPIGLENIVTEYSLWFIPLCLLLGVAYAVILYYREKKNEFPASLRWVLATIRALLVAWIAFLLLNPLLRSVQRELEKPVVLVLQDNSESVSFGNDSVFYASEFPGLLDGFREEVQRSFDLQSYVFGTSVRDAFQVDFSDQETNMGEALDGIYDRYSHKNVGALVLLSDGINNRGVNPLYAGPDFTFPLYTVALGDTSLQRDLVMVRVNYNRIAYKDNMFPVEINVMGRKCKGLTADVTIERNGRVLFRQEVTFGSDNDFRTLTTTLEAREQGLQKYTVRISPAEGEVTYLNNVQDIYVDVLEDRQKILMLYNAPHPDVSAIRQTVTGNANYTLDEFQVTEFKGAVTEYNLVILHGLPSVRNNMTALLSAFKEASIPTLFFLTGKTYLPLFNEQQTGVVINPENILYNEAIPLPGDDFSLFSLSDKARETIRQFPPLVSPYGSMEILPSAVPLFFQQIGAVGTTQPLWLFNQSVERKTAVVMGPGIWKWRIREYSMNNTHEVFTEVLNKSIQYLALRVDKSLFRVYGKDHYTENEEVELEAEVYNEVYELVNGDDVTITIRDSDSASYPFTFSRTSNAYYLNAGNLRAGTYSYTARVNAGGVERTETGEFTVSASRLEKLSTQADHDLLFNLAGKYGGSMYYPGQLDELAAAIRDRDDIKTITYSQKRFSEMLNLPWLLGLILLLLSTEWFIRKRAGGY